MIVFCNTFNKPSNKPSNTKKTSNIITIFYYSLYIFCIIFKKFIFKFYVTLINQINGYTRRHSRASSLIKEDIQEEVERLGSLVLDK
jgi:uncharacterized membrane protein